MSKINVSSENKWKSGKKFKLNQTLLIICFITIIKITNLIHFNNPFHTKRKKYQRLLQFFK